MSNPFANWWQSRQLKSALKQSNTRLAVQLLQQIQNSGVKLSPLEKLFRDKLQFERSSHQYKREATTLSEQLTQASHKIDELQLQLAFDQTADDILNYNENFIEFIFNSFKLLEHDEAKLQCTGIDKSVFDDFEVSLVEYLKDEFSQRLHNKLEIGLQDAHEDIDMLKTGQDPESSLNLTPHVYFMKYFLENVYGAYIAWFLIYKSGLLPTHTNILDIAAGPGTVAYGLALLLNSMSSYLNMPKMHISYYSLEEQAAFQYRGLQFWRKYIESQETAANAYFRFDTNNIFNYLEQPKKLPKDFFDFIVISHCLFADTNKRLNSYKVFKDFFDNSLKKISYVLLIVQGRKLFKVYDVRQSEDPSPEKAVIKNFLEDLGLKLEWYKYVTSTGKRTPTGSDFARFASDNLPPQVCMSKLLRQYLGIKHNSHHYVLDDYVILAKKG